ncbi:MAG: molybdopterin dinucleotide binding domain-containing protein [bacterium]
MENWKFLLITGRSFKQGQAAEEGKFSSNYISETTTVEIGKEDAERLKLIEGTEVKLRNSNGEQVFRVRISQSLPSGVLFIPYGPPANMLIPAETGGTGMPSCKGIEVELLKEP